MQEVQSQDNYLPGLVSQAHHACMLRVLDLSVPSVFQNEAA